VKLSVAYTFEDGFIQKLAKYPEVKEVFGKLTKDIIGGGRASYLLDSVSKRKLKDTVNEANENNISFNYLLNGANLNNIEHTKSGHQKIRKLLDFLVNTNIKKATVASPFLFRLIKKEYPDFKIKVSAFAMVNSPEKAKQWEDLGADEICISGVSCNRNFKLLNDIRNSVKCGLQLIVNASCIQDCIYEQTHMNILTNSSRTSNKFYLDYCFLHCTLKRLKNPVNFIKSIWIRPEDLKYYEDIGYDSFKILERNCPSDLLIKRVKAYVERSFGGNLLELISPITKFKKEQNALFTSRVKLFFYFFKPLRIKLKYLLDLKNYIDKLMLHDFTEDKSKIYIDNKSLDSYLPTIMKKDCNSIDCESCKYCNEIANSTIKLDKDYISYLLALSEKFDKALISGSCWV
jgi:collagenase-like PrtC family protease